MITTCTADGCDRPFLARGLCRAHYYRLWRKKDPSIKKLALLPKLCTIQGCEKPVIAKGLCSIHYQRVRFHGDPSIVNKASSGSGSITEAGYRRIESADGKNYEHRHVMEQILGRPLTTDEVVHHINGDKLDNRPENLALMTNAEHARHHATLRDN